MRSHVLFGPSVVVTNVIATCLSMGIDCSRMESNFPPFEVKRIMNEARSRLRSLRPQRARFFFPGGFNLFYTLQIEIFSANSVNDSHEFHNGKLHNFASFPTNNKRNLECSFLKKVLPQGWKVRGGGKVQFDASSKQ